AWAALAGERERARLVQQDRARRRALALLLERDADRNLPGLSRGVGRPERDVAVLRQIDVRTGLVAHERGCNFGYSDLIEKRRECRRDVLARSRADRGNEVRRRRVAERAGLEVLADAAPEDL